MLVKLRCPDHCARCGKPLNKNQEVEMLLDEELQASMGIGVVVYCKPCWRAMG